MDATLVGAGAASGQTVSINGSGCHLCPQDQRRLEQGRGKGRGIRYVPWIWTNEFGSRGIATRIKGIKIQREHHLLSLLELRWWLLGEWLGFVVDQNEQFPQLPLDETVAIARSLGVRHPRNKDGLCVLTTDNLWWIELEHALRKVPFSIKPSEELADPRVQEKLEIERQRWMRRGYLLIILTEKEIPVIFTDNIREVRSFYFLAGRVNTTHRDLFRIEDVLLPDVQARTAPLNFLCLECDAKLGFADGTSLTIAKNFLARQRWLIDMNQPFKPDQPLNFVAHQPQIQPDHGNSKKPYPYI